MTLKKLLRCGLNFTQAPQSRLCGLTCPSASVRPGQSHSHLCNWLSGYPDDRTDKQTRGENNGEWKESGPLSSFSAGFFLPSFPPSFRIEGAIPSSRSTLGRRWRWSSSGAPSFPFTRSRPRERTAGRAIRAPSWLQCDSGSIWEFVRGLDILKKTLASNDKRIRCS